MFSKISVVKNNANPVFNFKVENSKGEVEDRSKWTFNDWSKNDAKGLSDMANSNPEQFKELSNSIRIGK
jgi:glutathione peroxidase-family protein